LDFIPSKKSNLDTALKYFLKTTESPREFYHSLEYTKKRKFQALLYPEGLQFSLQNKQNLTSKTSVLFELTNCISVNYKLKKERTYQQKANKSVYVHYSDEISNNLLEDFDKFYDLFEEKNL
jgi:hypothetical protein